MDSALRSNNGTRRGGLDGARATSSARAPNNTKSDSKIAASPIIASALPPVRALATAAPTERVGTNSGSTALPARFVSFEELDARRGANVSSATTSAPLGHYDDGYGYHRHHFSLNPLHHYHHHHRRGSGGSSSGSGSSSSSGSGDYYYQAPEATQTPLSAQSDAPVAQGAPMDALFESKKKKRERKARKQLQRQQEAAAASRGYAPAVQEDDTVVVRPGQRVVVQQTQSSDTASAVNISTGKVVTIDATKLPANAVAANKATGSSRVDSAASAAVQKNAGEFDASVSGIKRGVKAVLGRKTRSDYVLYAAGDEAIPVNLVNAKEQTLLDAIGASNWERQRELSVFAKNRAVYVSVSQAVNVTEPLSIRSGGQNLLPRNVSEAPLKYRDATDNRVIVHYPNIKGGQRLRLFKKSGKSKKAKKEGRTERWVLQPIIITFRSIVDNKKHQAVLAGGSVVIADTTNDPAARAKTYYARYTGKGEAYPRLIVMKFAAGDLKASWNDLLLIYDQVPGEGAEFDANTAPLLGSETALVESLSALADQFVCTSTKAEKNGANALGMLHSLVVAPAYGDATLDAPFAQAYVGALNASVRAHADAIGLKLGAIDQDMRTDFTANDATTKGAASDFARIVADVASDMRALDLTADEIAVRAGLVYEAVFRHIDAASDLFPAAELAKMTDAACDTAQNNLETLVLRCLAHTCSHLVLKTGVSPSVLAAMWGATTGGVIGVYSASFVL